MNKKQLFLILIFLFFPLFCFGTSDGGESAEFLGFVGDSQEYALIFTYNINELELYEGSTGVLAIMLLIKMDSCKTETIETVGLFDETDLFNKAYEHGNINVFWNYYRKNTNLKKLRNLKLNNGGKKVLPKVRPSDKLVNENIEKYNSIWLRKIGKFSSRDGKTLVVGLKNSGERKQKVVTPYASIEGKESLGRAIFTSLPLEILYDADGMPRELEAYENKNNQIIALGSIAHTPRFNGTYFPLYVVWPNKQCKIEHWNVQKVRQNDVLNIREDSDWNSTKIGEIPFNGSCIKNYGCVEWGNQKWCNIKHKEIQGWVSNRYLREGDCKKIP